MKNVKVVLDDNKAIALLRTILEPLNYEIHTLELNHRVADEDFTDTDLIVFDPNIGDTGLITECIDTLKSRKATSRIPILLITRAENEDSIIAGLNAGANEFILLPSSVQSIGQRIKSLLPAQKG